MLLELKLRNFAIFEHAELRFSEGLTVLTGETGAGKSILVDALDALLGGKISSEDIRAGCQEGWLEALFDIKDSRKVQKLLDEQDISLSEHVLVIRRTFSRSGKNRSFMNDRSVTMATLQRIGEQLIDLHGQHSHQSLLHEKNHLNHLDDFDGKNAAREAYRETFNRFRENEEALRELEEKVEFFSRQSEGIRYQLQEIRKAELRAGEEEDLRREREILKYGSRLRQWVEEAYERLHSDEGILKQLQSVSVIFQNIREVDSHFNDVFEMNASAAIGLQEVCQSVRQYRDRLEDDPNRLEAVEQRLFQIEHLKRKLGRDVQDILEWVDSIQKELEDFESARDELGYKKDLLEGELQRLVQAARSLSSVRKKKARGLEKHMERELKDLGMEKCGFKVSIDLPDLIDRNHLSPSGADTVEFLISPNPGEGMKPLSSIASGGELSRIMLAVRTPKDLVEEGRTLVFDEVDAGLGGAVAEAVGGKLKRLSKNHQVICITHLPQIATQADEHFVIEKNIDGRRTLTSTVKLNSDQRIKEIARMLGGKKITTATMAHAKEMLNHPDP